MSYGQIAGDQGITDDASVMRRLVFHVLPHCWRVPKAITLRRVEKKRKTIALISVLPNLGHLSVAVVYITMGLLAGLVAVGVRGRAPELREAIYTLKEQPFGPVLLVALAVCALCLGIWRFLQGAADLDQRGRSFVGWCRRSWQFFGALLYTGLSVLVLRILVNAPTPSGEETARATASKIIIHPAGWFVIFAVGVGVGIAGIYYFSRAIRGNFHGLFRCDEMSEREKQACFWLGRLGYAARGLILCVLGYVVGKAGYEVNPWGVGGQATALNEIMLQPLGPWVLGLTSLGLVCFGVFYAGISKYGAVPEQKIAMLLDEIQERPRRVDHRSKLRRSSKTSPQLVS